MKQIKKCTLGLFILILMVAGSIALMGKISGKSTLSCIVSCGLIAIGMVLGLFLLWLASDRESALTGHLFEHEEKPGPSPIPIPVRKPEDDRF